MNRIILLAWAAFFCAFTTSAQDNSCTLISVYELIENMQLQLDTQQETIDTQQETIDALLAQPCCFDGTYNSLSGAPTNLSDLINDAGFLTEETDPIASAAGYSTGGAPTHLSDLINDAGFLTEETDPIASAAGYSTGGVDGLENYLSVDESTNTVLISGANLQVVSGEDAGWTEAAVNGTGNIIIGYDENSNNDKSGSHNLVVGKNHTYSSYGGIVVGKNNSITGAYSSVLGGSYNIASGESSSVSGGGNNTASGYASSISGGASQTSDGTYDSSGAGAPTHLSDLINDAGFTTFDGHYSSLSHIPAMGWVDLSIANLMNDYLYNANLSYANLSGAHLQGAHLNGANLINANLMNANLSNADLNNANLSYANLQGANFTGANGLTSVTWTGAFIGLCVGCPCVDDDGNSFCD